MVFAFHWQYIYCNINCHCLYYLEKINISYHTIPCNTDLCLVVCLKATSRVEERCWCERPCESRGSTTHAAGLGGQPGAGTSDEHGRRATGTGDGHGRWATGDGHGWRATGDRHGRRATGTSDGHGRWVMGDERRAQTSDGHGRWAMGDGRRATGTDDEQWATGDGHGRWAMGDGRRARTMSDERRATSDEHGRRRANSVLSTSSLRDSANLTVSSAAARSDSVWHFSRHFGSKRSYWNGVFAKIFDGRRRVHYPAAVV